MQPLMSEALTIAIDAVATPEAPRRRRADAAATNAAPFAQHIAAFYPYPWGQNKDRPGKQTSGP